MHMKVLSQPGVKVEGAPSLTPPAPPDDDDEFCIKCLNTCNLTFVGCRPSTPSLFSSFLDFLIPRRTCPGHFNMQLRVPPLIEVDFSREDHGSGPVGSETNQKAIKTFLFIRLGTEFCGIILTFPNPSLNFEHHSSGAAYSNCQCNCAYKYT